jgi:hypothetical protein
MAGRRVDTLTNFTIWPNHGPDLCEGVKEPYKGESPQAKCCPRRHRCMCMKKKEENERGTHCRLSKHTNINIRKEQSRKHLVIILVGTERAQLSIVPSLRSERTSHV